MGLWGRGYQVQMLIGAKCNWGVYFIISGIFMSVLCVLKKNFLAHCKYLSALSLQRLSSNLIRMWLMERLKTPTMTLCSFCVEMNNFFLTFGQCRYHCVFILKNIQCVRKNVVNVDDLFNYFDFFWQIEFQIVNKIKHPNKI